MKHHQALAILSLAGVLGCGEAALSNLRPDAHAPPPARGSQSLRSACDFSQRSSQVVLTLVVGPYGGKQDLELVHADGTTANVYSFGADRTDPGRYIFINDIEVALKGDHLLASRGSDGAIVLDRGGALELEAADINAANAFLSAHGAAVEDEGPSLEMEQGAPPVAIIHAGGQLTRTPLPDYHGEPNVNVASVRGTWGVVSSYQADRDWRVNLQTAEISPMTKAIPSTLREFGCAERVCPSRLYLTLDDDGGFLATLRDSFAGGVYHSPDGAKGWVLVGSAARQVSGVYATGMEQGTYVISGMATDSDDAWPELPADHPAVISGPFVEITRPATQKHYTMSSSSIALSDDGLCAAYLEREGETGPTRLGVLNIESGVTSSPDVGLENGASLQWIPIR